MAEYFEAGQYGFFIWSGFGAVAIGLLGLAILSKIKFKRLNAEFDRLKAARGDRRKNPINERGENNGK